MLVAIDAGHGSNTSGKRTPDGYREHWANVRCAHWFAKALERHGILYIRTGWNDENAFDDADIALSTRQKSIRSYGCEYSFSFHFNAHGNGSTWTTANGIEALVSDKDTCIADSMRLAKAVQSYLQGGTKQNSRGVKRMALSMCNCSVMKTKASILMEMGFMTNQYEAGLMKNDSYCKECAEECMHGFCDYLGIAYVPDGSKPVQGQKPVANQSIGYGLVFDARYYADKYADLKKAFGYDEKKLLDHFKNYGMKEGRQAISTFNVQAYKKNYADLRKAFGEGLPLYYEHFIQYGYKEGRKAV